MFFDFFFFRVFSPSDKKKRESNRCRQQIFYSGNHFLVLASRTTSLIKTSTMFAPTIFAVFFLWVSIKAEPSLGAYQAPVAPPTYNYYEYRSQQVTPSPYVNKRHQNYVDQQYSSTNFYGQQAARTSTSNQCKLHINCPSKFR